MSLDPVLVWVPPPPPPFQRSNTSVRARLTSTRGKKWNLNRRRTCDKHSGHCLWQTSESTSPPEVWVCFVLDVSSHWITSPDRFLFFSDANSYSSSVPEVALVECQIMVVLQIDCSEEKKNKKISAWFPNKIRPDWSYHDGQKCARYLPVYNRLSGNPEKKERISTLASTNWF